ncbi:JmjC domain-containing protein, partial [Rhodopirellula baltica]|uniref:JmjC domain-containing protein n=1 Tax=Rhodopirellula baltica TaxID=265606 RepID=UPI0011819A52
MSTMQTHKTLEVAKEIVSSNCDLLKNELDLDTVLAKLGQLVVQHPIVRVYQDGHLIPSSTYTASDSFSGQAIHNVVDANSVRRHLKNGSTIAWQNAELFFGRVAQVVRELERELNNVVYVTIFATPQEQVGLESHWDSQDVVMLQLNGCKNWRLGTSGERDAELKHECRLEVGDTLCLPRYTQHQANAGSTGSFHLSFVIPPENIPS